MSAQDKLGIGMLVFLGVFAVAFFVVPPELYQRYRADLQQRQKQLRVKLLFAGVLLLSVPYFYDQLVGLSDKTLSRWLEIAIGACANLVLIDVAWFAFKNLGPPSLRIKRMRK